MCHEHGAYLIASTLLEIKSESLGPDRAKARVEVNRMIRDWVRTHQAEKKVDLVDLELLMPYHSLSEADRKAVWEDDGLHLKPAGWVSRPEALKP